MLKYAKLLVAVLLIAGCAKEPEPRPTTPLIVKTDNGDIRFSVEVARTPEELKTGLMNRSTLAFNSGMIFNIDPARPTAMWMKNTKIPLDMLFIAPNGAIIKIVESAQPMSEQLIISRDPVRAVVELNAGQVKRHGIKIGDKITHMLLNNLLDIKTPGPEAKPAPAAAPAAPKADIPVPELPAAPTAPEAPAVSPETPAEDLSASELDNLLNPPAATGKPAPAVPTPPAPTPAAAPKLPVPAPM